MERWDDWYYFDRRAFSKVKNEAGVYQLRWAPGGEPRSLPRLWRNDLGGTLLYGRSMTLRARLRTFVEAARTGSSNAQHAGGWAFYDYYRKRIPFGELQFRWQYTGDEEAAGKLEVKLIDEYRVEYGYRPPLNKSVDEIVLQRRWRR